MMGTVVWILILAMICTDIALLCAIHRYDRAYDKLYSDFIDVMEAVNLQAVSEKEFHKELQDFNTNIKAWYDYVPFQVFVSEYDAPKGCVEIAHKEKTVSMAATGTTKAVERIFTQKRFVEQKGE